MAKKPTKKTLPKDLDVLIETAAQRGDDGPVRAALESCLPDARGGYGKGTVLMNGRCSWELAQWAVARGTDVNAGDTWGYTPLHEASRARFGHLLTPEQLFELGADVHRTTDEGLTPLHSAADGKNERAVRVLLAHGADLTARSRSGHTALEYALGRMSNNDFPAMVPVARVLLEAGALRSEAARQSVRRAAETFEFHREGFAKDSVEETARACAELCRLFDVEPPGALQRHDGTSRIDAAGQSHEALWKRLVPPSGACATVQGEVIRLSGRLAHEVLDNGGANWDGDFRAMARAFLAHVSSGAPLSPAALAECEAIVGALPDGDDAATLMESAVEWVQLNPDPTPLPTPAYRR